MSLLSGTDVHGFDQVRLGRDGEAGSSAWTRKEFEKLPLVERVRLLAGGQMRFFLAGKEVSTRDALKSL